MKLGVFDDDPGFSTLFSLQGQPALAPWRLALITMGAVCRGINWSTSSRCCPQSPWLEICFIARIDWFRFWFFRVERSRRSSAFGEFRTRLIEGGKEQQLLEGMLSIFKEKGLLKSPQKQRTDSTHILAAIRVLGRLENIGETLRFALNSLAAVAPDWLQQILRTRWLVFSLRSEISRKSFPNCQKRTKWTGCDDGNWWELFIRCYRRQSQS